MSGPPVDSAAFGIGRPLPPWRVQPLSGGAVPALDAGRPTLVLFFSLGCPGCRWRALPYANRVVVERGDEVAVLGVLAAGETEDVRADLDALHVRFPVVRDTGLGATAHDWRTGGTPHWVLTDRDGRVVDSIFGSDPNRALLRLDYHLMELAEGALAPAPLPDPEPPPQPHLPTDMSDPLLTWADVVRFANHGNPEPPRRVEKTEAEWRAELPPDVFQITRLAGTERAHSSEMCSLFEPGLYACACCGTLLFDAGRKFESGTGWPSFTAPVEIDRVAYHADTSYGMTRIEIVCNVCDGHLGHVFPDGPAPSGLRYCVNALSLEKQAPQKA